jgi:hypothetical protein
MVDGQTHHEDGSAEDDEYEGESETGGEDETVEEPTVGLVEAAGTVGLREVGVEAEENAGDAEGDGVVEDLAEGGGGDGEGGVGHVSHHDGVDDAHGHPAEFGEDEREGEREHGPDLLPSPLRGYFARKLFAILRIDGYTVCKIFIANGLRLKYLFCAGYEARKRP